MGSWDCQWQWIFTAAASILDYKWCRNSFKFLKTLKARYFSAPDGAATPANPSLTNQQQ